MRYCTWEIILLLSRKQGQGGKGELNQCKRANVQTIPGYDHINEAAAGVVILLEGVAEIFHVQK